MRSLISRVRELLEHAAAAGQSALVIFIRRTKDTGFLPAGTSFNLHDEPGHRQVSHTDMEVRLCPWVSYSRHNHVRHVDIVNIKHNTES